MKIPIPLLTLLALAGAVTNSLAAPVITNQPIDLTLCQGETATFCVGTDGAPPLTYQWRDYTSINVFTNIPGETNACLVLSNAQPTSHRFGVVVTDTDGSVTSRLARLTVIVPPSITQEPNNATVEIGQTYSNSVTVAGTPPLAFQWYFNGQPLSGKTTNILVIANVQTNNAGEYFVSVTNSCGTVTSRVATLTVTIPPPFIIPNVGDNGFLKTGSDYPAPCWLDYNGDGWLDVLLQRGWVSSSPMMNELYRNNRDGTFSRVTNGLTQVGGRWSNWPATTAADIDCDGDLDFLIEQWTPRAPTFFINQLSQGTLDFTPIPFTSAIGVAASFADFDNDGWTDVALTCGARFWPGTNSLLRNILGEFQVVSNTAFAVNNEYIGCHYWVDYDEDGDIDFLGGVGGDDVAHQNVLFQNQGEGNFARVISHFLIDTPSTSSCACWGDYDNDGHLDVLMLYWTSVPCALYRNLGQGQYERDTRMPSLTGALDGEWVDYDNDGDLDLYLALSYQAAKLFDNDGSGTLTEVLDGCPTTPTPSFQLSGWGDYNNDGFQDLLAIDLERPSVLFLNCLPQRGNRNHWLKVQLKGSVSNPNGLGAKIRLRATIAGKDVWQLRHLGLNWLPTSHLAHFGLGDATQIETLRIEWPSGIVQELSNVAADQFLTITEPPLLNAGLSGDGAFQMTLTGNVGVRYDVLTSSNLTDWVPWQSVTNTSRKMRVIDAAAASHPHRFYRATLVP